MYAKCIWCKINELIEFLQQIISYQIHEQKLLYVLLYEKWPNFCNWEATQGTYSTISLFYIHMSAGIVVKTMGLRFKIKLMYFNYSPSGTLLNFSPSSPSSLRSWGKSVESSSWCCCCRVMGALVIRCGELCEELDEEVSELMSLYEEHFTADFESSENTKFNIREHHQTVALKGLTSTMF